MVYLVERLIFVVLVIITVLETAPPYSFWLGDKHLEGSALPRSAFVFCGWERSHEKYSPRCCRDFHRVRSAPFSILVDLVITVDLSELPTFDFANVRSIMMVYVELFPSHL